MPRAIFLSIIFYGKEEVERGVSGWERRESERPGTPKRCQHRQQSDYPINARTRPSVPITSSGDYCRTSGWLQFGSAALAPARPTALSCRRGRLARLRTCWMRAKEPQDRRAYAGFLWCGSPALKISLSLQGRRSGRSSVCGLFCRGFHGPGPNAFRERSPCSRYPMRTFWI